VEVSVSPPVVERNPPLDVARVRQDFPILSEEVNGRPLVYLDNAATTQKPVQVLDAMDQYYRTGNANVHRGMHELSRRATGAFESARNRVAHFLGTGDPAEVIWTRGTTEAINLVASSWGGDNVGRGDEILLSEMEHHSNLIPWQLLAARTGARLRFLPVTDEGTLDLSSLDDFLTPRTRLVALAQISNALGTIHPVQEISRRAHAVGAVVLVDGAQGAAHHPVDVGALGADFYAFSGHKMCGPTGIGVLWGKRELLEAMSPYQGGGEMISLVEHERSTWANLPHKFEAGTPNIAGAVGLAAAIDYLEALGFDAILRHEQELLAYALSRLEGLPGLRLFGPPDPRLRSGILSFLIGDAHAHDISTILDAEGVAIRAGHHCTQLLMRRMGVAATARASFYLYNTREEVDRWIDALGTVLDIFGGLPPSGSEIVSDD